MNQPTAALRRAAFAVLLFGSAKISIAQQSSAAGSASESAGSDEIVQLSPFAVNAQDDRGYHAQNLLSGSRLKSQLKDIATPVSAFTEQFFIDTGINDTNELANYMLSTEYSFNENAGSTGTNQNVLNGNARPVRVRGLSGGTLTTNFFNTGGVADTFSSERIEQARGPNSILFGISNPGGLINTTTKRARLDGNTSMVAAGVRSYDGTRFEFDHNQVGINGKAAVRVAGVSARYGGWRNFEYRDTDGLYATAKVKLSKNTELNIEAEKTHVDKHTSRTFTAIDAYTPWRDAGSVLTTTDTPNAAANIARISGNAWIVYDTATGEVSNWRNKNQGATKVVPGGADNPVLTDFSVMPGESTFYGPGFDQSADNTRLAAYLTHTWRDFNIELAAMRNDEARTTWDPQQNVSWYLRVDPNVYLPLRAGQTVAELNPNAGKAYFEAQPQLDTAKDRTDFLRASANYRFDLGKWFGNHLIAGVAERDYFKADRRSVREYIISPNAPTRLAGTVSAGSNVNNRVWQRTYIDLDAPSDTWFLANPQLINTSGKVERTSGLTYTTAYIPFDANTRLLSYESTSLIGMLQSSFWNDRLKTVVGASRDERDSYQSSQIVVPIPDGNGGILTPVRGKDPSSEEADNYSFSGVFSATSWMNLTYSHATNSGLAPNSGILHSPTGRPPAAQGKSQDYGFKFSLLNDRIYLSVLRFETSAEKDFQTGTPFVTPAQVNVIWTALNLAGVRDESGEVVASNTENTNAQTFSSESEGYEVELIANLTPNWRAFLNFSQLDTKQSDIGPEMLEYLDGIKPFWTEGDRGRLLLDGTGLASVAQDNDGVIETVQEQIDFLDNQVLENKTLAEGRQPIGSSKYKLNVRTNYDFLDGALKGFGIGGGMRYWTAPVVGYNASLDSSGNLVSDVTRGSEQIFFDGNISYRRNTNVFGLPVTWSLQLNVDNILDNDAYMVSRVNSAGSVTSYRFNPGRSWSLTSRFTF